MNDPVRVPEGGELSSSPPTLSRAEFAAGFDRCWRTLWCVAVGVLGDRWHAEDVVQEAALIAMDKLDQFDRETNLTAWLAKIVRNVALNHSRRRKIEKRWIMNARDQAARGTGAAMGGAAPGGHVGRDGTPDDAPDGADEQVLASLAILSDTARTCLLMRTVLDLSYREIATALEIPPGTAMSHVHRARAAMRSHLESTAEQAPTPKGGRR